MSTDRTPTNAEVLADLGRVKVLFQARAVALALGAVPPIALGACAPADPHKAECQRKAPPWDQAECEEGRS